MPLTPLTIRQDLKCGKGAISQGEKCSKGTAQPSKTLLTAGAVGLGVGVTALSLLSAKNKKSPYTQGRTTTANKPYPPTQPLLRGTKPKGLLTPGRIPKSKTQRMRENTAAAVQTAERRIAETAKAEVTRVAQIGNTMAATGEATGMAVKTTLRELRLRTEAARRRFEPGYRSRVQATTPPQLPEGTEYTQIPFTPRTPAPPERVSIERDPRTGQPRRNRGQGFKPRADGPSTDYYRTHPEANAKKVRHQAAINRRPEERERRVALNRERRKRGIDGKGGPDVSHTSSGGTVLENASTNRARNGAGGKPKLKADDEDGKKYTKVVTNPETGRKNRIRYGAKGYSIAPGTDKGDRYCARSFGDMKSHGKNCSGADRNTPLCLSRSKWACSGKSSRRDAALTPGKS